MTLGRRILAIIAIFLATSVAWGILGASTIARTEASDSGLRDRVSELWGAPLEQTAPTVAYTTFDGKNTLTHALPLSGSDIKVNIDLSHRRKGLLWYSTYGVSFIGDYTLTNATDQERAFSVSFGFPQANAVYDNFHFIADGREVAAGAADQPMVGTLTLAPGESKAIRISYDTRGMDEWRYSFGKGVAQVRNFKLTMTTNFADIDFPAASISPTVKTPTGTGWQLTWDHTSLVTGSSIGMAMPEKLNPGPLASRISFFAPISLLFFFFVVFVLSVLKDIKLHPMHYFFLAAAFFAFHLLFAYLVDQIDVNLAFIISAVTSVSLVVSYLRIVAGARFAFREAGLAQLVYLVLFSYAHFFKGLTGLTVAIGAVITLAILMQATARIDWEAKFRG